MEYLYSFYEEKSILFSVHNLALDAPLFLTRGLLIENNGECIKTIPCGLEQNDHGHEIVLNQIKYDILGILIILLEVDSPFIGGKILYHSGHK